MVVTFTSIPGKFWRGPKQVRFDLGYRLPNGVLGVPTLTSHDTNIDDRSCMESDVTESVPIVTFVQLLPTRCFEDS